MLKKMGKNQPEEKAKYDLMDRGEKANFRQMLFSKELAVAKEQLKAHRKLTISEKAKGTMLTARRISVELGNDPAGAVRYCLGCLRRGPTEYEIDVTVLLS